MEKIGPRIKRSISSMLSNHSSDFAGLGVVQEGQCKKAMVLGPK